MAKASATRSHHTEDMSNNNPFGGRVIAVGHRTLWWAIDAVVETLPLEKLIQLNVRAGEHLAVILTTAFLGAAPRDIDTTGGVDLTFRLSRTHKQPLILSTGLTELAFEVKSLPGPHREWEKGIERDQDRCILVPGATTCRARRLMLAVAV